MQVKVINISKNPLPKYETPFSAGMDVRGDFSLLKGSYTEGVEIGFGCTVDQVDEKGKPTKITINPMGRILIPTGLSMEIPVGYEVQVRPRSGLALKHGITLPNSPGTIDADYRGDCGVILQNVSNVPFEMEDGERLCQFVLNKFEQAEWVSANDLSETERGEGGFGHSGRK